MRKKFDVYNPELCLRREVKLLSHIWLFATPWTVAHQAPPFMEFSSQKYWSGLPFPSPGDLPDPGIKPVYPTQQTDALLSESNNIHKRPEVQTNSWRMATLGNTTRASLGHILFEAL